MDAEMYRNIITMCWSIKEVNKNLSDRRSTVDYSIKFLKNACSDLAGMLRQVDKSVPNEAIDVVGSKGQKMTFTLKEIADMLYDAKKIIELNLINNIDSWARAHADWEDVKNRPMN
ncbi:MAG: hypothetical protein ACE14P_15190 [Methanotrichaceae archaeon]